MNVFNELFSRKDNLKKSENNDYEINEKVRNKNSLTSEYAQLQLSIHPSQKEILSNVNIEILKEEMNSLPPIKKGKIDINNVYIFKNDDNLEAKLYIRNGVDKRINFEKVPLNVINSEQEIIASQVLNLRELGDIPPYCARPYKIYFDRKNIFTDNIQTDDCKIVFASDLKVKKTVNFQLENYPDSLSTKPVQDFIRKLQSIALGNIDINLYKIHKRKNGDIAVSLLVRNATDKKLNVHKIPIALIDKIDGQILCNGEFTIEKFTINPFKAQVRNLIFRKNELKKDNFDLNNISVKYEMF